MLLFHDIAPAQEEAFAALLRWLSQSWRFVDPETFSEMIDGEMAIEGDNLLLTFDDGFLSHRTVADRILKPMGICALFFVVSTFVDIEDRRSARYFIARHIIPGVKPSAVPGHMSNLRWSDLVHLLRDGHSIGGHTLTHARLSGRIQTGELETEICAGADRIESRLGVKVEHFACTFGDLRSFGPAALNIARSRFRFIYTGMRGDNARSRQPWAIRRDSASPDWPTSMVGTIIEGGTDLLYASRLRRFEAWGKNTIKGAVRTVRTGTFLAKQKGDW